MTNKSNIRFFIINISLFFITSLLHAQDVHYKQIDWDSTIIINSAYIDKKDSLDAIRLCDESFYEYIFKEKGTILYHTIHRKIHVLTDRGIEAFNRVYIAGNRSDLVNIKIRTTSAQGIINELNSTEVKEIENLENKGNFKIFAIEGIEKNGYVEMIYTMRKPAGITGRYTFQDEFPTQRALFELRTPESLVFETKAYNGAFNYSDTIINQTRIQRYRADTIPALIDEKYCTYDANLARVDYTFSRNTEGGEIQNNWLQVIRNYSDIFYTANEKVDKKIIKQLNKLKIAKLNGTKSKIQAIENYIKGTYAVKDLRGVTELEDLSFILKNKFSNEDGITHLFIRFFELAGISHSLGISCNRNDARFDKEFVSWHNLNEYVIYFSDIDMYLSPTATALRLGLIPTNISNNYGVFIKKIGFGSFQSVQPEIRFIPALAMERSSTIQNVILQVDTLNKLANVKYHYEVWGNEANFIKPYYDFLPQESRSEMLDQILLLMGKDTKILSKTITGTNHEESAIDSPLIIDCAIQIPSLIEQAGSTLLVNIGNVIGEQVQMYSNKKRKNLIDLDYTHNYRRKIEVIIPDGYNAKGLDDIIINKEYGDGKENTMGFISNYKQIDNKIIIEIYEYYKNINYPVEQYEQFRAVINAAADFNKKVIVLEHK